MHARPRLVRGDRNRSSPLGRNGNGNGNGADEKGVLQMNDDDRVVIIAPVGQDAPAMATLLESDGFRTRVCQTAKECAFQINAGAGTLVLTQEVLDLPRAGLLFEVLRAQPTWSELPLIILTSGGQSRLAESLDLAGVAAGTVTLLERPITTRTFVHSVQVALHSRRRQYQARELVRQLETLNETLEQRVAQRTAEAVERAQQLRLLSAELSGAEERERRRIAQILHDDLQQLLMAARMHFAVLRKSKGGEKREVIAEEIAHMLEEAFELTRSLSVELAPSILRESGLAAALEWLASHTRKYYDMNVAVETDSSANPQAADVRAFLFRAVRELLLNAVKHGGGRDVRLIMDSLPAAKVRIVVADDGAGFDPAALDEKASGANTFGLFNIRERVDSFGGEFRIESARGRGTRVTLVAPCGFLSG
jgi:signal transduction histidine kinase